MTFTLHPRLEQDCITIGRFELCRLLMMNDSQYPWFILVPERANLQEIYQLSKADREYYKRYIKLNAEKTWYFAMQKILICKQ